MEYRNSFHYELGRWMSVQLGPEPAPPPLHMRMPPPRRLNSRPSPKRRPPRVRCPSGVSRTHRATHGPSSTPSHGPFTSPSHDEAASTPSPPTRGTPTPRSCRRRPSRPQPAPLLYTPMVFMRCVRFVCVCVVGPWYYADVVFKNWYFFSSSVCVCVYNTVCAFYSWGVCVFCDFTYTHLLLSAFLPHLTDLLSIPQPIVARVSPQHQQMHTGSRGPGVSGGNSPIHSLSLLSAHGGTLAYGRTHSYPHRTTSKSSFCLSII